MKRILAISMAAILAFAAAAAAQSAATTPSGRPLAEVAKTEEARRRGVKKPAKVYTNSSLGPAATAAAPVAPSAETNEATPGNASAGAPAPAAPAGAAAPAKQDQAYWQDRIKQARDQVRRSQLFADSLQTRINSLTTDFVNRDNPVEKAKIEQDRKSALAELDRVKKEIEDQNKAIATIEDEARRAGVPPGWLRPGA
jgi:hypothetical protein